MRKFLPFTFIVTAILVVAVVGCQSTATPSPTPTIEPTSEPTGPAVPSSGGDCYVVPPVSDQDWVRGPADAPITLIEYADFQ
ncbi:MAG TPA: hypothetical protein ENK08_02740 [Chloroflexi bacterium]|nr:hypothetical protein [Chloroflexota bacterium]